MRLMNVECVHRDEGDGESENRWKFRFLLKTHCLRELSHSQQDQSSSPIRHLHPHPHYQS